jgi:chromate transporter
MTTNNQPSLLKLFSSFLRLGLTAFGGPSMVAYIRKMAVEDKQWLDKETFGNGVALCQIIPGATAMQAAAYVGLKKRGISGAAATFVGFGLPAFLFMSLLAAVYESVIHYPISVFVFSSLQAIIVAIIANATISFGKVTLKEWKSVLITIFSIVLFGLKWNPIIIIVLSAALGILLGMKNQTCLPDRQVSKAQAAKNIFLTQISAKEEKTKSYARHILIILLVYAVLLLVLFFLNKNLFVFSTLMFRIDLFAYGGGFASVPLMFHEIVDVRHLLSSQTFLNGIALGQVTPGPIVITATFIGYLLYNWFGAIIGTISIFLPSFLILTGITPVFDKLRTKKLFNEVIVGVLSSFVGLLFTVTIQFGIALHWGIAQALLGAAALIALLLKTDILYVVLIGIAMSFLIFFVM